MAGGATSEADTGGEVRVKRGGEGIVGGEGSGLGPRGAVPTGAQNLQLGRAARALAAQPPGREHHRCRNTQGAPRDGLPAETMRESHGQLPAAQSIEEQGGLLPIARRRHLLQPRASGHGHEFVLDEAAAGAQNDAHAPRGRVDLVDGFRRPLH